MKRTGHRSARHRWPRGTVVAMTAGLLLLPAASSSIPASAVPVDASTREQLSKTARLILAQRAAAQVERLRARPLPQEIFGVRISPALADEQRDALRELQASNRAPVEGGPPFTEARTELDAVRVVRTGDLIVLDAIEHTEMEYEAPATARRRPVIVQSVRRRFEFEADGDRLTLLGERPLGQPLGQSGEQEPGRPVVQPSGQPVEQPSERPVVQPSG